MKAVMLSIRPQWCELIASGRKTIEVRKSRPKLDTPFKCYIYCTNGGDALCPPHMNCSTWCIHRILDNTHEDREMKAKERINSDYRYANGKVIGEFTCDGFYAILTHPDVFAGKPLFYTSAIKLSCLTLGEIEQYSEGKDLYGWHISSLKIYDIPKELSEFKQYHRRCKYDDLGLAIPKCKTCQMCNLKRPPQSWCYVEELEA